VASLIFKQGKLDNISFATKGLVGIWMDGWTSCWDVREEFLKIFLLIFFFPLDFIYL
jgi:hypothetical protein